MISEYNVQISKRCNYGDLKKRIADCLSAMHGVQINETQLRLWKIGEKTD